MRSRRSRHLLFRSLSTGALRTSQTATADAVPVHDPPLSPHDEAVFLLNIAAEVEHALMVQYLFAAYSLRDPSQFYGRQGGPLREPLTGPNGEIRFLAVAPSGEETEWELRSKLPDKLQTPYWIVSVPKEIIRDHSDIFNENALAMMARLFRVSNPQAETGLVTTAAPRTMHLVDLGEKPAPTKRKE